MQEESDDEVCDDNIQETMSAVIGAWGIPRNFAKGTVTSKFNLR